jgi:folate-binding protein YgfZ
VTQHITHLSHRGVLQIEGEDKATFLQGLITNDITSVTPQNAIYSAFLNPQGRFLYDFFIAEKEGSYFLDCENERLDALLKKLTMYKLRSRVNLIPRLDLKVYAVWGPEVSTGIEKQGIYLSFMDPRLKELGARMMGDVESNESFDAYDLYRIQLGVPESSRDLIPEKSILLECGLDELNAVSWTKGCYVGQELTARTKHVGQVRKKLFPVTIENGVLNPGSEIYKGDSAVGRMMSVNGSTGLALLRIEDLTEQLTCDGKSLKVIIPTWMNDVEKKMIFPSSQIL